MQRVRAAIEADDLGAIPAVLAEDAVPLSSLALALCEATKVEFKPVQRELALAA